MLFSIIVPTCHRNDLLAQCLECIAPGAQTQPPEDYEVIVTDDGVRSTAEGLIREKFSWARWFLGPRLGPAANRNSGASYARGEWLAFLDDDCLPDPGWLRALINAVAEDPGCSVFEGRTYPDRERASLAEVAPVNETGGYLWSCNFAIRRTVFYKVGGFDERYPYAAMEDVDLRKRLQKQRHTFQFVSGASVCHPWRSAGGWSKLRQYERSVGIFLSLHPEQIANFGVLYYLRMNIGSIVKETLPGAWSYRGAGLLNASMRHCFYLRMAIKTLFGGLSHRETISPPLRQRNRGTKYD